MRIPIVIDANVLLSAALKRGFTYQILLKLLLSKEYDLYIPPISQGGAVSKAS